MHIRIYGPGCARCHETEHLVEDVLRESRIDATLEKISGMMEIATSGILSVPAIAIDGKIMATMPPPLSSWAAARPWLSPV